MKLTDKRLRRRDAGRNIGTAVLQAVREIKAGKGKRVTVAIPAAVEAHRKAAGG